MQHTKSALGRIRTCDTGFRRAVLYPLSYEGEGQIEIGGENSSGSPVLPVRGWVGRWWSCRGLVDQVSTPR